MTKDTTLLLIDDDATLIEALQIYLSHAGYDVRAATNGTEGLRKFYTQRPNLIVLDVMMPEMDGWETCRRIRELSKVPIIMLTAKGRETDRVKGFRLGADDYVPKPFSLKELKARIDAVLRRVQRYESEEKCVLYVTEDIVIDSRRWEVRCNGKRLDLTPTEMRLLLYLAENAGCVLSHHQILREVWGPDYVYVEDVDYPKVFVWRLRQKIEEEPGEPLYILTERGIGYRMVPAEQFQA